MGPNSPKTGRKRQRQGVGGGAEDGAEGESVMKVAVRANQDGSGRGQRPAELVQGLGPKRDINMNDRCRMVGELGRGYQQHAHTHAHPHAHGRLEGDSSWKRRRRKASGGGPSLTRRRRLFDTWSERRNGLGAKPVTHRVDRWHLLRRVRRRWNPPRRRRLRFKRCWNRCRGCRPTLSFSTERSCCPCMLGRRRGRGCVQNAPPRSRRRASRPRWCASAQSCSPDV